MKRKPPPSTFNRAALVVIPGLFAAVPLVFDADLYSFSLLPKRILLQVALFLIATLWARELTTQNADRPPGPVFLPAIAFRAWSVLSVLFADLNTFTATAFLSHQVTFFFVYLVITQTATSTSIDRIVWWGTLSALLFSGIGILEFWGFDTSTIPSNGRPSSTFEYRNFAASYLLAALPLIGVCLVRARSMPRLTIATLSAILGTLFLVYTRSRGAWLGGLVGGLVALGTYVVCRFDLTTTGSASRSRGGRTLAAIGVALILVLSPWSPNITSPEARSIDAKKADLLDAMSSVTDSGAGRGRWTMWSNTVDMIADSPLTGVGLNNWQIAYPPYDTGQMILPGSAPERPHNDYLWIAAETGLPGLLLYAWMIGQTLWMTIGLVRRRDENAVFVCALLFSLVAIHTHGFFSFPRERIETSFFIWGAIGLVSALACREQTRSPRKWPIPWLSPAVLALCSLVTIVEIRFDRALLKGLQSFAGGDLIGLDRHTREGLDAGPFDSRMHLLRNKVHQGGGNYLQAQRACLEGLRYHPNSVELLSDLGMAYALGNDLGKAETALKRAIDLAPKHHQTHNNLGGVYQKMQDFPKAKAAYTRAAEIKPDYKDALSNLGLLLMVEGDYDGAVSQFEETLQTRRPDAALHHNLADALYLRDQAGDRERALKHYTIFLRTWRGDVSETDIAKGRMAEIELDP